MKNWDPLSVFKYLRGAETMHLAFFILTVSALPHAYDEMEHREIYEKHSDVLKLK